MTFSQARYYRNSANPRGELGEHGYIRDRITIEEHCSQASQRRLKQAKNFSRSNSPQDHLTELFSSHNSPRNPSRGPGIKEYGKFYTSKVQKSSRQLSNGGKLLLNNRGEELMEKNHIRTMSRAEKLGSQGNLVEQLHRETTGTPTHGRMISLKDRASVLGITNDDHVRSSQLKALTSPKKLRSRGGMVSPLDSQRDVLSRRGAEMLGSPFSRSGANATPVVGNHRKDSTSKGSVFDQEGAKNMSSQLLSRKGGDPGRIFSPGKRSQMSSRDSHISAFKSKPRAVPNDDRRQSSQSQVFSPGAFANAFPSNGSNEITQGKVTSRGAVGDVRHNKAPIRGKIEDGRRVLGGSRSEAHLSMRSNRSIDSFGIKLAKPKNRVLPDISEAQYDELTKNQKKVSPKVNHNRAVEDFWSHNGKVTDLTSMSRAKMTQL